jgi:hypothetical protein
MAAQNEAERADEKAEAAHERLDTLERAFRAMLASPGSLFQAFRDALEILDGTGTYPRGEDGSDGLEDGHWEVDGG